jgi:hypothetical protein
VSTYNEGNDLEFFEEPATQEAPGGRPRRRVRPTRGGGPKGPAQPPHGTVALARLAGLVALAIAVVIGLVFWVDSCQGQSRHDEYASYMTDIKPIAQNSAASLSEYQKAVTSPKLTLADLQTKLGLWSRQQQEYYDQALRLVPPAPLQAAHQEVLTTLQLRAIGLAGLANTIAESGGTKLADQVAPQLAKQAQALSASDLVWAQLFKLPATDTLKRLGITNVIAPASQIVTNPELITAHSFGEVYGGLSSSSGSTSGGAVSGNHGSQLVGTTAVSSGQSKTLSPSSPTTVDVSADLAFKVTFQNIGDFPERDIVVTLTVNVFSKQVATKKQTVTSMASKETKTLSFTNLQLPPSAFGANATVNVVVGKVPGEDLLTNNRASYPVFFSLPSNG